MQEGIAESLTAKIRDRMSNLRVGTPLDKGIDVGAIVAPVQLERIKALVARGVEEGAVLWQPKCELPSNGLFFPPTMLTNVHPSSTVAQQEIFGPVLSLVHADNMDEALAFLERSAYGNQASLFTSGPGGISLVFILGILIPILAIALGFDSVNGGYIKGGFAPIAPNNAS